ncbi:MAG: hypothetical protein ACI8RD_010695, partial [Bacillariaceae sp.]
GNELGVELRTELGVSFGSKLGAELCALGERLGMERGKGLGFLIGTEPSVPYHSAKHLA